MLKKKSETDTIHECILSWVIPHLIVMLGVRRVGILGHHDVGIILSFHLESDVGTVSSRVKGVLELCILSVHSCSAKIGYRFV